MAVSDGISGALRNETPLPNARLEVVLSASQKVMSNYTKHFANTSVDASFTKFDGQKRQLKTAMTEKEQVHLA